MKKPEFRVYNTSESVVFWKTKDRFGGLSNMAGGYPLLINNRKISTSEALYQALKFPHLPDLQERVILQSSPIFAKNICKPYKNAVREDWLEVRTIIMRWCLRVKLVQNWQKFSDLLLETKDRPIVEYSEKDDFWGAMQGPDGNLHGANVLGRLLMELREQLKQHPSKDDWSLALPTLPNLKFLGLPISTPPKSNGESKTFFD